MAAKKAAPRRRIKRALPRPASRPAARGKRAARPAARKKSTAARSTRRPAARKTASKSPAKRTAAAKRTKRPATTRTSGSRRTTRKKPKSTPKPKAAAKRSSVKRPARAAATRSTKTSRPRTTTRQAAASKPPRRPARRPRPAEQVVAPPALDRERRRLPDEERSSDDFTDARLASSARAGRDELKQQLAEYTETSPALTGGDIDAKWEDAYAVGDEAPGGDNPTPDQDRVDDIGKALGVTYQDNEELQGSDKIIERDRHRWELDPASSEDWPHGKE